MKHIWDTVGIASNLFFRRWNSINVFVFTVKRKKGEVEIFGCWSALFYTRVKYNNDWRDVKHELRNPLIEAHLCIPIKSNSPVTHLFSATYE
jgi:hypothetical protein